MIFYLVVSSVMFFAGVYGFIARKNMLAILISLELMLNSVDLIPLSRSVGRVLLYAILYRYIGCRNSYCHCNYHQHIPKHQKYPG